MDLELFQELGFTPREAKVYLALLELGLSKAGPIVAKTRMAHPKVYETLERLIQKGLVSYIIISKTRHFQAADPKEILNLLDEKKHRFKSILNELEVKKQFSQQKQTALIHEGYKAIQALFNNIVERLEKRDFYYAFAFKDDYKEINVPLFFSKVHQKIAQKKVKDFALANHSVKKQIQVTYSKNENIQIRFTKKETPLGVVIVKNKVLQLVWGDLPTCIEITSPQIHQQYKRFFEELWHEAKK